jgi:hypothetical protein
MRDLTAAIAFAVLVASAQGSRGAPPCHGADAAKGGQSSTLRESILRSAAAGDLAAVVKDILVACNGSNQVIEVRPADDIETVAATSSFGPNAILYNPKALAELRRLTEDEWAVVFLLAHEVMHHLVGHTTTATPPANNDRAAELEVNELAGLVLRRLGASLEEAVGAAAAACALVKAAQADTDATVAAVRTGWRQPE